MITTLADALARQGYETLTPVQEAVTDPGLGDADLLVSAQTGSGKTVAFGLAIAPTLLGDQTHFDAAGAPLALIIAPTRELAMQVCRELTWLYGDAGAVVTSCVGGMDQRTERRALDRGAHVVVATPGRLCDHIKRGNIDLSALRAVVLDEADEMLDLGFREELEFILSEAPEDRRTLLFSATVPAAIAKLAQSYQRDARRVATAGEARQHADIEYRALNTHPRDTENAIINVLRYYEARNAIVFCNTRAAVARLTTKLTNRGFSVVALSGELTQSERTNALQALRDGRARVCVATDVAARGIDLPNLELVIHAELPSNADTLLHRSGRTGRAGRKGVSALIVPPKFRTKANRLIGWAKLKVEWADPPSAADVTSMDEARLMEDSVWTDPVPEDMSALATRLAGEFTAEQLAAGFVNLFRTRLSAPEELTDAGTPDDRPRQAFGPSVWFSVQMGRNDGAEPRVLLPMICRRGDLTKDDIGAIRIRPTESFIEVLESRVDALTAALGPDMQLEEGVTLTRRDGPPAPDKRGPREERGKGRTDRGPRPAKPAYDPDAAPPRAPRREKSAATDKPHKPAAAPKGKKPPKSHKTDRSPMKPGETPKPKSRAPDSPERSGTRTKAVWTKENRDAAKTARRERDAENRGDRDERPAARSGDKRPGRPGGKPGGKPFAKHGAKPGGKSFGRPGGKAGGKPAGKPEGGRDDSASRKRAADTSKRFVPPNKRGQKPGPKAGKGPNATPKRRG
ncbi:DEAD/DEAH box helicase [uncultured Roseobacter sp.]|uniref:DEAD/DEAH box helicase n=1 Tax=uncultured Roseobacter sp. TaxID=114847 RepID=UPI00260E131E|nr:DEAD/DEAH box helicase [uncultured Roseobacter sp.]